MITDRQVRRLRKLLVSGETLSRAAWKTGMDRKTARKYRAGSCPASGLRITTGGPAKIRSRTSGRQVVEQLEANPGLQAKTLFEWLQRKYPGRFQDGQLRTFQRGVKRWRATRGPQKEVFFSQVHQPGRLCASDFTFMNDLEVTIQGQPFDHLLYHFVLTYSNWEWATICFSESFESLSEGLQEALWQLGGVPDRHRSDRLSAAVNNLSDRREFTPRYQALMNHYGLTMEKTNPRQAHENGDVESLHRHFKKAVEQALMLRGSRDFESREEYETFLQSCSRRRTPVVASGSRKNCQRCEPLPAHAAGEFQASSCPGQPGQPDSSAEERLLGAQSADWRTRGRACLRRSSGSLVRPAAGGRVCRDCAGPTSTTSTTGT